MRNVFELRGKKYNLIFIYYPPFGRIRKITNIYFNKGIVEIKLSQPFLRFNHEKIY